jgi:hypothetical protein
MPYHGPPCTSPKLKVDLRMLCEIGPGDIIFILGRWLQPFCSHAIYRVRVTAIQDAGRGYRRLFGALIDFKDSPVNTVPLSDVQVFRADLSTREEVKV